MSIYTAYIAVGSNMGDRKANCTNGIDTLVEISESELIGKSKLYETEPLYVEEQQWFINAVFGIKTKRPPMELFHIAKKVETIFGRDISAQRYGPRVLDMDLLIIDDLIIDTPQLILPHSRLHERRFVLQPFVDIAPNLNHPILNKTIQSLLFSLDDENKKVYCDS
jgi:2-amino-4-hydroxy-6-hydroxymethyldihydropteridine diphosphokinase